ncbi:MAG: hypothetical protein ACRCZS_14045, partial [Chroococcidiopsis sp.]
NASSKLQEELGKQSLPLVTTGLKALSGILEFAANNVSTLTTLINIGLVASLLKGVSALGKFALAEQQIAVSNSAGKVIGSVGVPRIGVAAQGIRDFVKDGGIRKALRSQFAQDLGGIGAQAVVVGAGIGAFQKLAENFTGGEALQTYNKQLELTKERLAEINKVEGKVSNGLETLNDRFNAGAKNVQSFAANLLSLNFSGAFDNIANGIILGTGGDPNAALSDGPLANRRQADNRAIVNSALDQIESKEFQDKYSKGVGLANRVKGQQELSKQDKEFIQKTREDLQARKELLEASIADPKLKATTQGQQIETEVKNLEKLINALGGTGSAYIQLGQSVQKFNEVTKNQIELTKLEDSARLSKVRAQGDINEFDLKTQESQSQIAASKQIKATIAEQIALSDKFLASNDFALLNDPKKGDPKTALNIQQQNLDLKKQYAEADKQIDDLITQNRLDAINRRTELLQREVAEQERVIAKLESIRRVRTTGRDAGLSEAVANQSLSPQALRLQQPLNTIADAQDEIVEQEKRRQNALKNLRKAQANLRQINPNDEQQFEQGKADVAQYQQAVLAAEAEINVQRKAGSEAAIQYRNEIEEQIKTVIDLTVRKSEQAIAKEIQAIDRLGNAQKRRIDDAIAGYQREQKAIDLNISALDRVAKISNKRAELSSAINQGAQIPLNGLVGQIRDAEGLIAKLKDKNLDPAVRGRTQGVLNQLGISNNEQDAFRYRIKIEDQIARLKADSLSAEIEQSQITLGIEERKETFAAKRAIIEAEITKQQAEQAALAAKIERGKAESEVRKSDIGVQKATAQLQLAQLSGDPNKVKEAALNLEEAKLTQSSAQDTLLGARQSEKLAKDVLPNATLSVMDALENFAATIETSKLSRRILGVTNQNKVSQFNTEEQGRVRGLAIEGIDKGVEVNIASGGATGFDPFGFRASRANDEMKRQEEIRRFQNNLKGIPNGTFPTKGLLNTQSKPKQAEPLDFDKYGRAAQQEIEKTMGMGAMPINFTPVTDMLTRLVQIEERLSGQLLALADRDRVQVNNTANYAVREPVLRDSNL